ncbi:MAG: hypothetical protein ABW167_19600 [Baekduia sp.]
MTIRVVHVESIDAICGDCGQGLWGGPPCEHKVRRAHARGERVAGLGTCSKCDDHNNPCPPTGCPNGCQCGGHGLTPS